MYKTKPFTIGLLLVFILSPLLFLLPQKTQAAQADFFKNTCGENECCLQYTGAMASAEADWNSYVNDLLAQPKPTSKKVDEAFNSLRTYDCWVRYVCESVRVSGFANPQDLQEGIRAINIGGPIPGCQAPEDVKFGDNWDEFVTALDNQTDLISAINEPNKIAFLPACMTNPPNNDKMNTETFQNAELQYQSCLDTAEVILGCVEGDCENTPSALAGLEIALKKDHAQQRANALERKLADLNNRVAVMQSVVQQVKNFLQSLALRYECAPAECT